MFIGKTCVWWVACIGFLCVRWIQLVCCCCRLVAVVILVDTRYIAHYVSFQNIKTNWIQCVFLCFVCFIFAWIWIIWMCAMHAVLFLFIQSNWFRSLEHFIYNKQKSFFRIAFFFFSCKDSKHFWTSSFFFHFVFSSDLFFFCSLIWLPWSMIHHTEHSIFFSIVLLNHRYNGEKKSTLGGAYMYFCIHYNKNRTEI